MGEGSASRARLDAATRCSVTIEVSDLTWRMMTLVPGRCRERQETQHRRVERYVEDNGAIVAQPIERYPISTIRTVPQRRSIIDAYLAIISVRVVREYADRPIPEEELQRILQAGRTTGSSVNRQEWKFYVMRKRDRLAELADAVYSPSNIAGCQVALAVTTTAKSMFDTGRCVQNMIVAAWSEGIGSSPNGVRDTALARSVLRVPGSETITTILSLGYPLHPHVPREDDVEGILQRINRKPLDELVVWVD
ncbi:MAG TPA: nitroreductase family protein, partial [Chloroflexota bacterium]